MPELAVIHKFYQVFRRYIAHLTDCYDEKVGTISNLEGRISKVYLAQFTTFAVILLFLLAGCAVLSASMLSELVVDKLPNRYRLDSIEKTRQIVATLPEWWLKPGSAELGKLSLLCNCWICRVWGWDDKDRVMQAAKSGDWVMLRSLISYKRCSNKSINSFNLTKPEIQTRKWGGV